MLTFPRTFHAATRTDMASSHLVAPGVSGWLLSDSTAQSFGASPLMGTSTPASIAVARWIESGDRKP